MKTQSTLGCVLGVLALSSCIFGQGSQYNDYTWARSLSREFRMHEMAEAIFMRMEKSGSTPLERQQGRLGMAELKQSAARRARGEERVKLYGDSAKLMRDAIDQWPDKNTLAYFKAIFSLCDLLEERGEYATGLVRAGQIDGARGEQILDEASKDYDTADTYLSGILQQMGKPSPEDDLQKWRIKNAAWYRQLQLTYNKMVTRKEGSTERGLLASDLQFKLEDYILENETDNDEAMLGALYGYLLLGQTHEDVGELDQAVGYYRSILDQVVWEVDGDPGYRLNPAIQGLVERVNFFLLRSQNRAKKYDQTNRFGTEMVNHYKRMNLEYRKLGRAALVQLAEARYHLGDMGNALALASEVVDAGGNDESAVLANGLVAEIIAATADRSQFSPEIIRSAAKGAFAQRPERLHDAIEYFNILLTALPKMEDETLRDYYRAETWYYLAQCYYFLERPLESAMACRAGAKVSKDVTTDDLYGKLAKGWLNTLKNLDRTTGSKEISKLLAEANSWMIMHPTGDISPGSLRYDEAEKAYRAALKMKKDGRINDAVRGLQRSAELFGEAVELGGPKKERALVKAARVELQIGEMKRGDSATESDRLLNSAKKRFHDYIKYANDPANPLTDPAAIKNRRGALAEAHYNIARVNSSLLPEDKPENEARIRELWNESMAALTDYEGKFKDQPDFVAAALNMRVQGHLAAGDVEKAEADVNAMLAIAPSHFRTARAALTVGKALKNPAEKAFKEFIGDVNYNDGNDWDAVMAKPGFKKVHDDLRRAADHYHTWLMADGGQDNFDGWKIVSKLYTDLGDWEDAAAITGEAVKRYLGSPKADEKSMNFMMDRLMHSSIRVAKSADLAGKSDEAARHWANVSTAVKHLNENMNGTKNPKVMKIAAQVQGGYVAVKDGLPNYFEGQGEFAAAKKIWSTLAGYEKASGNSGSPAWWEARFYEYLNLFKDRKSKGADMSDLKKALKSLKAATQDEFGGPSRAQFDWLEREMLLF